MKFSIITFLFLFSFVKTFSQEVALKSYYSYLIKDTIRYRVWLPMNWDSQKKYPSIYLNSYGALGNNGMLVAAHINNFINEFPATIVVEILSGNIYNMDYDYSTGNVGGKGRSFITSLREELIPMIEREYNTTRFRAFIGQSYSSSYANYLFLKEPGLFNAYMLFTPEKIGKDQPPFSIEERQRLFYAKHTTFYYLAAAGKDLKRRREYAEEIKERVKNLDSTNFHFEHRLFEDADHNDIVSWALLPGLQFIFNHYTLEATTEDIPDVGHWFRTHQENVKQIYGLSLPKTSSIQVPVINKAAQKKDKKGMEYFASYFQDSTAKQNSLMLFNTAYSYLHDFDEVDLAEQYFKKSIEAARADKSTTEIFRAYYRLAKEVYWEKKKDFSKAWGTMQNAFDETQLSICKYQMGWLASESGHNINEGIDALHFFLKNKFETVPEKFVFSEEGAYLLLSKCYYSKKDIKKSKLYLDKCLLKNPNYDLAKKWKETIKQ